MNSLKPAARLVGENAELLMKESVHSQQKIVMMAISLLIPVLLWLVQGTMLARIVMLQPWLIAIGVGIGCAFLIYWVDRLILTIPMLNGWVLRARLLLAFCIAVIGGMVMDLIIFNADIERKIEKLYLGQRDSLDQQFERSESMQEQKLIDFSRAKQARLDSLQQSYLAEIQGRGSAEGSGPGKISEAILSNLMNPAREEVGQAESALKSFREGKVARKAKNRELANRDNGLELRLDLLHSTIFHSWFTTLIFCAFTIGFFILELLPLMTKLSLRQTALDVKREQEEARQKSLATTWSKNRQYADSQLSEN